MVGWEKDLDRMIMEEEEMVDSFFEFDDLFEEKEVKPKPKAKAKKESINVDETMNFITEAMKRLS